MRPDTLLQAPHKWQNYYILLGEASATLTGLMFVAASLGTRLLNDKSGPKIQIFITPSALHFSPVTLSQTRQKNGWFTRIVIGGGGSTLIVMMTPAAAAAVVPCSSTCGMALWITALIRTPGRPIGPKSAPEFNAESMPSADSGAFRVAA